MLSMLKGLSAEKGVKLMKNMVFVSIALVLLADLLVCLVYCNYKNRKSQVESAKHDLQRSDENSSETKKIKKRSRFVLEAIMFVFTWLEGLLRLNLLLVGYIPSHHVRNFLYRKVFCVHLEKNAVIYYGAEIRSPWNLYVGEGSVIGDKAILDARHGIYIGKNVNFSTGVWIWTLQHDVNATDFGTTNQGGSVTIGDRAWLSCRTVVLPNVSIGEGAVIAAGGVVTKSVDEFSIWGGVPCKKIGTRSRDLEYCFEGEHIHFF